MAHGRRPSICHIVPGLDLVPGSASTRQTLALARSLAAHAEVTVAFRRVTGPVAHEPFDIVALEPNGHEASSDLPASRRALGRFIEERCSAHGTVLEGTWPMLGKLTAWCAQRGIPAVPIVERQSSARWLAPIDMGRSWLALGASGRYLRRAPVVIAGSDDLKASHRPALARRGRPHHRHRDRRGSGSLHPARPGRCPAPPRAADQSTASFWPAACSTAPAISRP